MDRKHKIYVLDEETSAAPGEEGCMQFIHPLTHIRHRVYIYDAKKLDAPGVFDGRLEYSLATAEIVPGLGKDEQLKFGSSISCTASDKMCIRDSLNIPVDRPPGYLKLFRQIRGRYLLLLEQDG